MTGDSGSVANWYARDIRMRRGMMGSLSWELGVARRGHALRHGSKDGVPDRVVIAFIGDGAMQMNGLNVMITISKILEAMVRPRADRHGAQQPRPQSGDVGRTHTARRRQNGIDAKYPDFPYHKYAELLGLKGIFVDDPEKLGSAWDEALAADRPVILECYTDPNVPPLPPHITLEEAKNFMTMTFSGTGIGQRIEEQRQASFGQRMAGWERLCIGRTDAGTTRGCKPHHHVSEFLEADGTLLPIAGLAPSTQIFRQFTFRTGTSDDPKSTAIVPSGAALFGFAALALALRSPCQGFSGASAEARANDRSRRRRPGSQGG